VQLCLRTSATDGAYEPVSLLRRCTIPTFVCLAMSACADVELPAPTRGVDEAAVTTLRKSAEQGNAGAQINLGTLYLLGQGALDSDQMALFWFRRAAEHHEPLAFAKLGFMYSLSAAQRGNARPGVP
jgi:TPR repeat protein